MQNSESKVPVGDSQRNAGLHDGDKKSATNPLMQVIFNITVGLLVVDLFGSFFRSQIMQAGIPLQPRAVDIPMILGLIILLYGNFHFYKTIVEPVGESAGAELFSLIGMLLMACLPIVLFYNGIVQFRYLILALYGMIIVFKNWQLQRAFRLNQVGKLFPIWKLRALAQTTAGTIAGACFYLLVDPNRRSWLFSHLVDCPRLSFTPGYASWVILPFNIIFLAICIWRFAINWSELTTVAPTAQGPARTA